MSEYINYLLEFYNEKKNEEEPPSYVEAIENLLKFYGIEID